MSPGLGGQASLGDIPPPQDEVPPYHTPVSHQVQASSGSGRSQDFPQAAPQLIREPGPQDKDPGGPGGGDLTDEFSVKGLLGPTGTFQLVVGPGLEGGWRMRSGPVPGLEGGGRVFSTGDHSTGAPHAVSLVWADCGPAPGPHQGVTTMTRKSRRGDPGPLWGRLGKAAPHPVHAQ